jgi:hypothetical protein
MEQVISFDWPRLIEDIASPMRSNETRERWLDRAARKSQLSYRQVKSLYYGQCKDPRTSITVRVLDAADKARKEAAVLATQFELLAGSLNAQKDSDRYSSDVLALINAARALRGLAGA